MSTDINATAGAALPNAEPTPIKENNMTGTLQGPRQATVQTLAAEVRVLMVGSRQVTLSVYRQLDHVPASEITPFGRVRDSKDEPADAIHVVGVHTETGALVRSKQNPPRHPAAVQWSPLGIDGWWKLGEAGSADVHRCLWDQKENRSFAVIASDGDDLVCWRMPGRYSYSWWRFTDEDTEAEAQRLAADDLAALREARVRHPEWAALPLIVLAGLR